VDAFLFEDSKNPTGLCVSMACGDGERTMIAMRGANEYLAKEEILKCIDYIVGSKIVYLSGYSLLSEKSSESIMYAVEEARNNKCEIYFNPGAPNIIRSNFKEIIRDFVDVLALSFDEAKVISGKTKLDDISNGLNEIAKVIVITLGEHGCIVLTENRHVHVPTKRLDVKDSTGAGDAFISGFMVGRVRGLSLRDCAELGNKVALNFLRRKNKRFGKIDF
jgi:sugar/nucleoside kinase (ribokinase family)